MFSIPTWLSTNRLRYKRLLAPTSVARPDPELWNYEKEGSCALVEKCYIHHNVSLNICAVSLRDWYENNTFFLTILLPGDFFISHYFPGEAVKNRGKKSPVCQNSPPPLPYFGKLPTWTT